MRSSSPDSHRGRSKRRPKRTPAVQIPTAVLLNRLGFLLNPKILLGLIALWIVYEGLISQHSVVNLIKFERQREELKQELADARAERDDLREKIALIESDQFTIEKIAREEMGLVREGEILYRYEEPQESAGEAPLMPPIVDEGETPPTGQEGTEEPQ